MMKDETFPQKDRFRTALNSAFRLTSPAGRPTEIELVELHEGRSGPRQQQFALTFRGPLESFLGQGTFAVQHDVLGAFDLFLVPIGREADSYRYEAVFNLLV